ncbi:MAG TPA: (Fe-S)-binding protein [Pyrinomonadaceae bacterium]|nr:(Fe-S)-binding protein [Pyrinomonadaceae bacterium]
MKVSVFVTCLVDQLYPAAGLAMCETLERLGVEVSFNAAQTCCGQPAFNTGFREEARDVARPTLELLTRELESCDYVVAPSGSCTAMIKNLYPVLFAADPARRVEAERVGARVYEYSQFLVDVMRAEDVGASFEGRVTYHSSCHALRELGVSEQPRKLIAAVRGCEFVEAENSDVCCGFGGTFALKYPDISAAIADEKIRAIERSGAGTVVSCDAGCLMQMAGMLSRRGSPVRCLHIAELLAPAETQTN